MNIGEFTNPELNLIQLNNDIQSITNKHFQSIEDKFSKKIHNNDFILTFIKQIAEENKTLRDEMKILKEEISSYKSQNKDIEHKFIQIHSEINKLNIDYKDLKDNSITLEINEKNSSCCCKSKEEIKSYLETNQFKDESESESDSDSDSESESDSKSEEQQDAKPSILPGGSCSVTKTVTITETDVTYTDDGETRLLTNINNSKEEEEEKEEVDNSPTFPTIKAEEKEIDEDEFKCERCLKIQGLNNCQLCDAENVCEDCFGQGGDYGPNEIWVCNECLPTCLQCKSKLYSATDSCCGKGRTDDDEEEEEEEEEVEEEEEEVEEEEVEEEEEEVEEEVETENEEDLEEEEDGEVIEVEIEGKTYYCDDEEGENGNLYEDENGEVGNIVGKIIDGEPIFNK